MRAMEIACVACAAGSIAVGIGYRATGHPVPGFCLWFPLAIFGGMVVGLVVRPKDARKSADLVYLLAIHNLGGEANAEAIRATVAMPGDLQCTTLDSLEKRGLVACRICGTQLGTQLVWSLTPAGKEAVKSA